MLSSIGQDVLEALFITATEPKKTKYNIITNLFFSIIYVCILLKKIYKTDFLYFLD